MVGPSSRRCPVVARRAGWGRGWPFLGAPWVLERVGFDAALAKADFVLTGEGAFDRTSSLGKATGEVLRRARAARKPAAVVTGHASETADAQVVAGDGSTLDAAGLAALAERATREALGLPAS
jgi:glycerate kinase